MRQGAPDAVQVADRWHLLRNLGDAIRTIVDRQHAALRRAAKEAAEQATAQAASVAMVTPTATRTTAAERRRQEAYARRQARYEEAARLRAADVSITRIARQLGAERKTIRAWLHAAGAPLWRKPPRAGVRGPCRDHLERRWAEGRHNAAQLWRELVNLGFSSRLGTVRRWAGQRRKNDPRATADISRAAQPPSARQTARMLMTDTTHGRTVGCGTELHLAPAGSGAEPC